jgi:hypothetical protein
MRKLPLLYAAPYLFTFLAIFAALNPLWLREFPRLQLYDGELEFSEEKSFGDLHTLVTHFPQLSAGSEANHASAQWMAERFRQMGMETTLESFEILAPEDIWHPAFLFQPIRSTHQQITGTNVLAFRQGRSPSVVLLMANRDGTRLERAHSRRLCQWQCRVVGNGARADSAKTNFTVSCLSQLMLWKAANRGRTFCLSLTLI